MSPFSDSTRQIIIFYPFFKFVWVFFFYNELIHSHVSVSIIFVMSVLKILFIHAQSQFNNYISLRTRSYYCKENAADVSTNQELLFHASIVSITHTNFRFFGLSS